MAMTVMELKTTMSWLAREDGTMVQRRCAGDGEGQDKHESHRQVNPDTDQVQRDEQIRVSLHDDNMPAIGGYL